MSDILCDRCVDLVYPRPDCSDCERERIIAAFQVPDVVPKYYTDDDILTNAVELAEAWKTTLHPQDAMAPIYDLANRTSLGRAGLAAQGALGPWLAWLTWEHSTLEITMRLRVLPSILSAIKQLSPPPDNSEPVAESGPTNGSNT